CDRGDFAEYWALRERARRIREDARSHERDAGRDVRTALAGLRTGDVVRVPGARRRGVAVVVSTREGRPTLMLQDRRFFRASARDFQTAPARLAHLDLPRSGSGRSARYRRDLAARLATLELPREDRSAGSRTDPKTEARSEELDRRAREHPCHSCPDLKKHEHWAERASKLE